MNHAPPEQLQIQVHGERTLPALIYLPGTHGDFTLTPSLRAALDGKVCFVEFTYPRTIEWSLADYAAAIDAALSVHGICKGWLLAESFGSQVAWAMVDLSPRRLNLEGVILAGGFVRHPAIGCVRFAEWLLRVQPMWLLQLLLRTFAVYARLRHRNAPESKAAVAEFLARRTEADRRAAAHRLGLIASNDPGEIAARIQVPVFYLTGFFDPIVPWPFIHYGLKKRCPGYRGWKLLGRADHNVLGTAPAQCAKQILRWMTAR